jgi:glucosamine-phosphate N-acetyltransferase
MIIRNIEPYDYYKGFMDLLNELSDVGTHSFMEFKVQLNSILKNKSIIIVIEHNEQIIATGKIFIEDKFLHNMSSVGHIEDIVIKKEFRKQGLDFMKNVIFHKKT